MKNKKRNTPIPGLAQHIVEFSVPPRKLSKAELAALRATMADKFYRASNAPDYMKVGLR